VRGDRALDPCFKRRERARSLDAEVKDLASHDAITTDTDRFKEARIDMSVVEEAEDDGAAQAAAKKAADDAEKARHAKAAEDAKKGQKPAKDIVG
jgi:hypothetical protein